MRTLAVSCIHCRRGAITRGRSGDLAGGRPLNRVHSACRCSCEHRTAGSCRWNDRATHEQYARHVPGAVGDDDTGGRDIVVRGSALYPWFANSRCNRDRYFQFLHNVARHFDNDQQELRSHCTHFHRTRWHRHIQTRRRPSAPPSAVIGEHGSTEYLATGSKMHDGMRFLLWRDQPGQSAVRAHLDLHRRPVYLEYVALASNGHVHGEA